jgi:metallo-beta-lactamase family protein
VRLSFHGADRDVTGSCHMLECADKRILVDCGMLQGGRELAEQNADPFGFDPTRIDYVLLTHAHLDHCGRLPLLVKRGFRGQIICTRATYELARLVLLDSAHLQEEEARRQTSHDRRSGRHASQAPLYTLHDTLDCLDRFRQTAEYEKPIQLAPDLRATFFDAGHILGSASILVEVNEGGRLRTILFSGDIGNAGRPLLRPPAPPAQAEFVVMESTYGDRDHRSSADSIEELYAAVSDALKRGGNVVIPTFALERAQDLLYALHEGVRTQRIPAAVQVFLDSPMAISATEVFERHAESLAPAVAQLLRNRTDPFDVPNLHFTRETADSIAINRIKGGAIIMAGSGMCTGGRIRHHLRHNLWRPESAIAFVGFASRGTLARQIIDGARHVRIFGEDIQVKAAIHTINGFSAHADQKELVDWRSKISGCEVTFLVHGEEPAMQQLAGRLGGSGIEMPRLNQAYDL